MNDREVVTLEATSFAAFVRDVAQLLSCDAADARFRRTAPIFCGDSPFDSLEQLNILMAIEYGLGRDVDPGLLSNVDGLGDLYDWYASVL